MVGSAARAGFWFPRWRSVLAPEWAAAARWQKASSCPRLVVTTNYPVPDLRFGTGYFVRMPGGSPARCNPLTAPAGCRAAGLERLRPRLD
jgi:hypothetical protein